MAIRFADHPWATVGRVLAMVALILVILVAVVPGVPDWVLPVAVGVLALGVLLG